MYYMNTNRKAVELGLSRIKGEETQSSSCQIGEVHLGHMF